MALSPPRNSRAPQRILIYGNAGVGKSYCWLSIAAMSLRTGSDSQFYVIDTDAAVYRAFEEFPELDAEDGGNVHVLDAGDWEEIFAAGKEARKLLTPNDWVVLDMLSYPWEEIRNWYIEKVHGQDPGAYFLETAQMIKEAKDRDKGHERQFGGSAGLDWDYITKIYKQWEFQLTVRNRAHVFAVSEERKIDPRGSEKDTRELEKEFSVVGGFYPAGQKGIRHRFHTVLRMTKTGSGRRELHVVKDRHREHIWKENANRGLSLRVDETFADDYLIGIAGWRKGERRRRAKK